VINMLFIGRIYRQKNLHRVLESLKNIDIKINIKIIGKIIDDEYYKKIKEKYQYEYLGEKNKKQIIEIMSKSDIFIMPSENETFGLVYVESLSQNLPIIYSKNEGIDGYFKDNKYGVSVDPKSIEDIQRGIRFIINNYEGIQKNLEDKSFLDEFNWANIGSNYSGLY